MYLQDLENISSITSSISGLIKNIGSVKTALTSLSSAGLLPLTAALGTMYGVYESVEFVQAWSNGEIAVQKYGKEIEASKEKLQSINNNLSGFNNELENNQSKILELQNAYDNGTITAAQKEELDNLRLQNVLIDDKIEKLEEAEKKEKENTANSSKNQFNAEFGGDFDTQHNDFLKGYRNDLGEINTTSMIANIDTSSNVDKLNIIKYLTDTLEQSSGEDYEYYATALDIAKESFSDVQDDLYNHLQQQKKDLMANMNEDGTFYNDDDGSKAKAYSDMKAWEAIYTNYVDEYIDAAQKVREETETAQKSLADGAEVLNTITDTPSKEPVNSSNKSLADEKLPTLEPQANLLSQIHNEIIENSRLSSNSLDSLIELYPQLNSELYKYMAGLISEEQLFHELENCYERDQASYIRALIAKNSTNKDFFNILKTNYPELFNSLAEVYGNDVQNWHSLAQAKLKITQDLLQKMQNDWGNYFIAIGDKESGYELIRSSTFDDSDIYDHNLSEDEWQNSNTYRQALDDYNRPADQYRMQAQHDIDVANDLLNQLNDASYNIVSSNIDTSWQGLSGTNDSSGSTAEALNEFSEQIDWFERLTSRLSKIFDRFQRIISNAGKNWHTRFAALSSAMANINEQITAHSEAFDDYQTRFDSYDLDSRYKTLIANGQIGSETITDESLKNAIDECIQLYDNAQNCQDQLIELNNQLSDLAMQKFDNTTSQFEEILGKIEAVNTQLRNEADLLETKGYMASSSLYETLMEQETSNLNQLYKERQSLINAFNEAMNSGAVEKYSENWYSMQAAIDEVTVSLQDSTKTLAEYQNELRQLSWDSFDFTRDHVTNLIDESEFLFNLLKAAGTTDESGNLNANGAAAQSLLAQKYELDLKQAEEYAAEIGKMDKEIAKDPYNTTLLERRQELVKAQQDSILAAQDEKDAIKDLLSEAYSAYQEHLNKTIDKYKDLMNTMKDTWEYEKNIAEKTKNLAVLQKQYAAYQGDDSEEGRKNVQQLKEQIDEAENDLAQTEYEQLISDTEKLLDNISTETEEYFNQRLDQIDTILNQIISQGTADSVDVSKTIKDTAANAGYTLSNDMKNIWDSGDEHRTALQKAVEAIKEFTEKLLENSNKQAQDAVQDIAGQQNEQGAGSSSADNTDTGSSNETGSDNDSYAPASDIDWLYSKDYYPKDRLNTETSVIDRLKWHDFDSSFDARSQYYSQMGGDGTYYATYGQNVWMLDWMKEHGYRSGAKRLNSLFNGLAWTQDGGPELIRTSDGAVLSPVGNGGTIFNTQMTDNLWKWGQINPLELHSAAHLTGEPLYRTTRTPACITSTVSGGIHISLPNVTDYEDFCQQAQKDPKFEKMIQAMTLEQTLGKNSLNRLQF